MNNWTLVLFNHNEASSRMMEEAGVTGKKPTYLSQVTDKVHLAFITGFELTTLVMIGFTAYAVVNKTAIQTWPRRRYEHLES